jgi:hypothetical protein
MTGELPGPGKTPSFNRHIKDLFRATDRQAMLGSFDLWSYDDVRKHAKPILDCLRDGSMPCDGAWPPANVAIFERWVAAGMPQ